MDLFGGLAPSRPAPRPTPPPPVPAKPVATSVAGWQPIATVPRDGRMIDVRFDPATAERDVLGSFAELYAPGSTSAAEPAEPIIRDLAFSKHKQRFYLVRYGYREFMRVGGITVTGWRPAISGNP